MTQAMVNPQVTNSIQAVQQATLTGDVIRHSGAGKAYQSVSQSAAIAVQDATDMMRNMGAISTTATGVAMSQVLASGLSSEKITEFGEVLTQLSNMMTNSEKHFSTVGTDASTLVGQFPVGD